VIEHSVVKVVRMKYRKEHLMRTALAERDHGIWWSYVHANWWWVRSFHSAWPDGSCSERRCQDQAFGARFTPGLDSDV